jgi:hypothetical protein
MSKKKKKKYYVPIGTKGEFKQISADEIHLQTLQVFDEAGLKAVKAYRKKQNKLTAFEPYESEVTILRSGKGGNPRNRILIVTPTLGIIRMEWALARYGYTVPCNWGANYATLGIGFFVPMDYLVADAQNFGCEDVVKKDYDWMLLWEDDVLPPPDCMLKLNKYMMAVEMGKPDAVPVVSGLYFTKGNYSEPILYRGSGNSCFTRFKIGDKVWADGVPTGFLLIHGSIIKLMYNESEDYETLGKRVTRRVFETPAKAYFDPETGGRSAGRGTSDLFWCKRVISENVLTRAGWPKIGRKKYPFLCDTSIFCKHIDLQSGAQYPMAEVKK